jgi:hypothetical protein
VIRTPNRQTHGLVLSVDVVPAAETARLDEASTPIVDDYPTASSG